jgi:hypothetical protein
VCFFLVLFLVAIGAVYHRHIRAPKPLSAGDRTISARGGYAS